MQSSRPVIPSSISPSHTSLETQFLHCVPTEAKLNNALDRGEQDEREKLGQLENVKGVKEVTAIHRGPALSAHQSVPAEIWEMIFSMLCLALHEFSFNPDYHATQHKLPAMLISQVCSQWRLIAYGLPRIWSTVNVSLDIRRIDIPLELYLSKSKTCPLTVRIAGTLTPGGLDVWRVLSGYLFRTRVLVVALSNYRGDLPPIPHLAFPHLESYREEHFQPDETVWPWFWKAIREAPKLTMVSSTYLPSNFPFTQLTTWEVPRLDVSYEVTDLLDALPNCRSLRTLRLVDLVACNGAPMPVRKVDLPSLRQFSINTHSDARCWASCILESLVMPSLETCHIECGPWIIPSSSLLIMIQRSSMSLKRITFTIWLSRIATVLSIPPLHNIMQMASELTHFELNLDRELSSGTQMYRSFLETTLVPLLSKLKDGPPAFLPKLGSLSVSIPYIAPTLELVECVMNGVLARQSTPYPLRDVYLKFSWIRSEAFVPGPGTLERFKLLKEQHHIRIHMEDFVEDDDYRTTILTSCC
ncbi:hypothetical protein L218DRAFT_1076877 [Marasmius fiardii PR-910]|nr:hypothetical protein L218DRAFT_1076877 [Marasmius fiardii PR-910]